ncbi:serine/threonine kinase, partial [Ampelomyces quisqualis]
IIQSELLDEDHKHAILHSSKDGSLWYALTAVPLRQDQTTNPWLWDAPPVKLDLTRAYPAFNAVNMSLANTDTSAYTKKIDLLQQPTALFQPPWNRDITLREIRTCEVLKRSHHPNVCYYRGVYVDKGLVIGLVFDRYDMTLRDMLYNGHAINIAKCIQDIKRGIEYIHSLALVHCDIKPENIFVDLQSHRFVVGDFDSVHCEGTTLTLKCGTQGWVPEDEDSNNTAKYDIDWYSLAMIQAWL